MFVAFLTSSSTNTGNSAGATPTESANPAPSYSPTFSYKCNINLHVGLELTLIITNYLHFFSAAFPVASSLE